ncbi:LamG domain-containing protein [Clostridium sporogenes]|uniref:LamG domain-containing protein n=1 Tax=Clostridium sporogenes TaxID=1509 RepID=UPI0013D7C6CC|nr:LamG domain-containing protein [Clostridium sporogenes]NFV12668.1 LamG domain-containing protein [Clostridium sporogenes]
MTKYYPKKDYSLNLVAKWIFDNTNSSYVNGNTIYDLSSKGNDLTAYNITYKDDADLGICAYFNGVNSYAICNKNILPVGKKSILIKIKPETSGSMITYGKIDSNFFRVMTSVNSVNFVYVNTLYTEVYYSISGSINDAICEVLFTFDDTKNMNLFINNFKSPINIKNGSPELYNTNSSFVIGYNSATTKEEYTNKYKGIVQSIEIYNDVIEFTDNKYLIQDKNNILYTLNGINLVQAPSQILDENNFIDNGLTDTDLITKDLLLSKFENLEGIKLLAYTDDLEKNKCEIIYNCEPFSPIDKLKKNGDICNILFKEVLEV